MSVGEAGVNLATDGYAFGVARVKARPITTLRIGIEARSSLPAPAAIDAYRELLGVHWKVPTLPAVWRDFLRRELDWFDQSDADIFASLLQEAVFLQRIRCSPVYTADVIDEWMRSDRIPELARRRGPAVLRGEAGGVVQLARSLATPRRRATGPRDALSLETAVREFTNLLAVMRSREDARSYRLKGNVRDVVDQLRSRAGGRLPGGSVRVRFVGPGIDALFRPTPHGGEILLGAEKPLPSHEATTTGGSVAAALAHEGFPGHGFEHAVLSSTGGTAALLARDVRSSEGWGGVAEFMSLELTGRRGFGHPHVNVMRRCLAVALKLDVKRAASMLDQVPSSSIRKTLQEQASRTQGSAAEYVCGFADWREMLGLDWSRPFDWYEILARAESEFIRKASKVVNLV